MDELLAAGSSVFYVDHHYQGEQLEAFVGIMAHFWI